jgi:triacylglycerol lipase
MVRSVFSRLLGVLLCFGLVAPACADTYTQTKYPIMLVHGLFGFDSLLGIYDYWYGVPSGLRSGGAKVFAASVSASNDSTVRGEQLIHDLDTLRALYGYQKFNLIGHSQGGPTSRYVASVRPDLVASVTTIGSPHTGSPVADAVSAILPSGSPLRPLVAGAVDAFATLIGWFSGNYDPQDALAALSANSTAGAKAFNALHPEGMPSSSNPCGQGAASVTKGSNTIRYYSMGGTSVLTNIFDASDAAMGATSLFFGFAQNDGLVGQCASHFGVVLRDDYGWNHLDEVNQIFGLRGLFSSDPVSVIRAQVNRLKTAGL